MGSWIRKYWMTLSAAVVLIIIGAGVWIYLSMSDLPGIKAANKCQCDGYMLEQEIMQAGSIYSGRVTKITKSLNGDYTVVVQPEATYKGNEVATEPIRISVTSDCPYPFRKDHSYLFVQSGPASSRQNANQCSVIINTADLETVELIKKWLNADEAPVQDTPGTVTDPNEQEGNGALRLYQAIQTGASSIRIEEEGFKTWIYDSDESLFFYSPEAKISFFIPLDQPISQEDYEHFTEGISVEIAESGRKVAHALGEVNLDVRELPLVIKLFSAPSEDILIRFRSPDGDESVTIPIQYTEPFTYSITSSTDSQLNDYLTILKDGFMAVNYVENGRTHQYTIQFNQPVDRASVYEKVYESLQYSTISWSLQWVSDYEVQLSFDFDNQSTETVTFSLNGIKSETGYQLVSREMITIQAAELSVFSAIDLSTDTKEAYFTSITPYSVIDVSPDGNWLLTGVRASNGVQYVYQYAVRDRFGNVKKQYPVGGIMDPVWFDGGNGHDLLYAYDNELLLYDTETEETRFIWRIPEERTDAELVSIAYSAELNKLAAGAVYTSEEGQPVYDLYIFDGIEDDDPQRLEQFGAYECMEGHCAAPDIQFTGDNGILYTRWEPAGEDVEGYVPVLYLMNLDTMQSRRIDPAPSASTSEAMMFPLQDGRVLQIVKHPQTAAPPWETGASTGAERWFVYGPDEDTYQVLLDTNIGLFEDYWLQQVVPFQSGQILLHFYDKGWYLLDLGRNDLVPFPEIHDDVHAVDVEMNRIWFME